MYILVVFFFVDMFGVINDSYVLFYCCMFVNNNDGNVSGICRLG